MLQLARKVFDDSIIVRPWRKPATRWLASVSDALRRNLTIVFAAGDPVGTGFVVGLARPSGNVTGLSFQRTDLAGKRLKLLREVVPALRRLAILANAGNPVTLLDMREVEAAAGTLGLTVVTVEIRRMEDIPWSTAT
jgi:putative ABC transport system substrate-binding protein